MNLPALSRLVPFVLGASFLFFVPVATSWGQKKKAPPLPTGAPTLAFSLPLGIQRGVPAEFVFTGTNLVPASQFWTSFAAKTELIPDEKLAGEGKVKVRVEVPKDAPLGMFPVRLATAGGLSNLRMFCVDDLPQIIDNDANHDKAKPQEITTPCVVAGKIEAELPDYYKITVKAGQRLTLDLLGRRLGSPIDPLVTVIQAKNFREIAHDNDSPGTQGDPRLVHVFKEAGDYLIEVRDVLGRGGPDFVYRLRAGDFPLANVPIPMAAKAGAKVQVQFAGPFIEGVNPVDVAVPNEPAGSVVWVTPKGPSGQLGWPVPLIVSAMEEIVEQEPNQEAAKATRVPMPGGVTGRFLAGDDLDVFIFAAKKGQKLAIEAQTQEWGTPTPVYLVVKNAKTGAEIAKSNPQTPPPGDQRLEITAADDGDILIEVQHLLFQSGPIDAYHLTIKPVTPSFDVVLSSDKTEAAPGGLAVLPFQVVRKNFAGPIEVSVRGGELQAVTKVKAGQTGGVLVINLKGDLPLGARSFVVDAKATIDGQVVSQLAHSRPSISKALSDLVFVPLHVLSPVGLGIKEKAPFTLTAKMDPPDAPPGSQPNITLTVTRSEGFTEEIAFNPPVGLPATLPAPKIGNIAKDKTEVKFPLDVNAKTALGEYFLLFTAKAKVQGKDVLSDPALLPLIVAAPFDLVLDPATLDLAPGAKAKVKIQVNRKAGYKGPIGIEVKNLPAKVTGGKATINADQNSVEVEFAVAPDAGVIDRVELDVIGTATAMNNLQGTGPRLAVRVTKK